MAVPRPRSSLSRSPPSRRGSTPRTRSEYFSYLRSLWFDHDVSFENEYQYFYDHQIAQTPDFHTTFLELETAAHRRINYGTIGCAILWSPFYAVGDASARVMRAAGRDVAVDGYSQPVHVRGRVWIGVLRIRDDRVVVIAARAGLSAGMRSVRASRFGSARRSSSTCTSRRRFPMRVRHSPSRCS